MQVFGQLVFSPLVRNVPNSTTDFGVNGELYPACQVPGKKICLRISMFTSGEYTGDMKKSLPVHDSDRNSWSGINSIQGDLR
jgi:hypothetical protein